MLLRRHDPDRYLTALFAPSARRESLFALYAFNLEIARTREAIREPMMGRIRLQWWRDAIAAAAAGQPYRHEILEPLAVAMKERSLTLAWFERLIEAREQDIDGAPPTDMASLITYAEGSSSALIWLAFEILGSAASRESFAIEAGRELGVAWALTGLLRAVPHHARQRLLHLPADLLARHDVRAEDLLELRKPAGLQAVVREIAGEARCQLDGARKAARELPRALLPALLPGTLAGLYLERLTRAGFDPYAQAVQDTPPGRVWRLTWRYLLGRF
ncbi:phytoene/squalene synthase family protein [Hypericibacter sp.]|uniref:phytoene/squalene synthase family protein n=1 Tax=Hypericibacter sp. TaxID=2705401 RepID=UPI003D6CB9E4